MDSKGLGFLLCAGGEGAATGWVEMGGWQWGWGCRGVNGRVAVEMGAVVVVGIGGSQTLAFTDGLVGFPGLSHFPSEWRQPGGSWALKPGPHTEGWPELPVPPSVSSCGPLDSAAHAPRSPLQGSGGGDTWWMPSGRSPPPRAVSQARPESSSRLPWPCASLWGWEPQGPGGEGTLQDHRRIFIQKPYGAPSWPGVHLWQQ